MYSCGNGAGASMRRRSAVAAVASAVWFTTLGFGAGRLRGLFARPTAWRILDGLNAVTMIALSVAVLHG